MALLRTLFNSTVAGALLGILLVSLAGPRYIQWDSTAGTVNAMCPCPETARSGAERLLSFQLRGAGAGALAGAAFGAALLAWRRTRRTPASPPAA